MGCLFSLIFQEKNPHIKNFWSGIPTGGFSGHFLMLMCFFSLLIVCRNTNRQVLTQAASWPNGERIDTLQCSKLCSCLHVAPLKKQTGDARIPNLLLVARWVQDMMVNNLWCFEVSCYAACLSTVVSQNSIAHCQAPTLARTPCTLKCAPHTDASRRIKIHNRETQVIEMQHVSCKPHCHDHLEETTLKKKHKKKHTKKGTTSKGAKSWKSWHVSSCLSLGPLVRKLKIPIFSAHLFGRILSAGSCLPATGCPGNLRNLPFLRELRGNFWAFSEAWSLQGSG